MSLPDRKARLVLRLKRIRGQIEGLQREFGGNASASQILQTAAAARGALDGLIGEIIIAEIERVVSAATPTEKRVTVESLTQIIHAYLK